MEGSSEFAPARCQRFLSYIVSHIANIMIDDQLTDSCQVGWLSAMGWQAGVAVTAYGAAKIILQMAAISHPSYVPTAWSVCPIYYVFDCLLTFGQPQARYPRHHGSDRVFGHLQHSRRKISSIV